MLKNSQVPPRYVKSPWQYFLMDSEKVKLSYIILFKKHFYYNSDK